MKNNYLLFTLTVIISYVVSAEPVDIIYKAPEMPVTQNKVRPVAENREQDVAARERTSQYAFASLLKTLKKERELLNEDKAALEKAKRELENVTEKRNDILLATAVAATVGALELRYGWKKGSDHHLQLGGYLTTGSGIVAAAAGIRARVRTTDINSRITALEEGIKEKEKFLAELEEGIDIAQYEMQNLSK